MNGTIFSPCFHKTKTYSAQSSGRSFASELPFVNRSAHIPVRSTLYSDDEGQKHEPPGSGRRASRTGMKTKTKPTRCRRHTPSMPSTPRSPRHGRIGFVGGKEATNVKAARMARDFRESLLIPEIERRREQQAAARRTKTCAGLEIVLARIYLPAPLSLVRSTSKITRTALAPRRQPLSRGAAVRLSRLRARSPRRFHSSV